MARKKSINKSQTVRDYLTSHSDAMPKEVMAALAQKGINVSRVLVSTIKSKLRNNGRKAKKAAKHETPVEATPAVAEKPAKPNGTITLDQVKKVAQTVAAMGGFQRMTEMLEVIKEAGGVKKFKDLAEAMTVTAATTITEMDGIPF